jgi:hypothetical protein
MIMRADLPSELPTLKPNEPATSDVSIPARAAPEEPVETSVVELSALLLVVLTGIVLTFAGAIIALSTGS